MELLRVVHAGLGARPPLVAGTADHPDGSDPVPDSRPRWTLALLFVSGACALGYQVLWVRQFGLIVGADAGAVGVVVGAFMGGMALGYLVAGAWRPRGVRPLRVFGLLEVGIGVSALALGTAMPWVDRLADLLYGLRWSPLADLAWRVGLTCLCLLPPTFLMGASFPAFFAGHDARDPGARHRLSVGYALNLAGASAGALLLGFVLLELLGVKDSTRILGLANLALGATALLAARNDPRVPPAVAPGPRVGPDRLPLALGLASGFLSLWFEVVWVRAVVPFSGSTIYAVSVVLSVYLLGLGLGSRLLPWVARVGAPWTAGLLLAIMGLGIGGADLLAHLWFRLDPTVARLLARLELPIDPMWFEYPHVGLVAAIRLAWLTTWPVAVASGLLLPLLVRQAGDLGSGVGRLYGVNAVGCLAGSLLAQFVGLPLLGVRGSLAAAGVVALGLAAVAAIRTGFGYRRLAILGLAAAAVLLPPRRSLMRLFTDEVVQAQTLFYQEDAMGSVTVVGRDPFSREAGRLLVDGRHIAGAMGAPQLAAAPLSCLPKARRAAVIGLGTGATCEIAARRGAVVDCIEILPSVIAAQPILRQLRNEAHPSVTPPGVRYRLDDGRRFLRATSTRYDFISVDGNQAEFEGSAALLSHEFFEIVADRLAPGGLFGVCVGPELFGERIMERTLLATFPWVARLRHTDTMLAAFQPPAAGRGHCAEFPSWTRADLGGAIPAGPILTDDDPSVVLRLLRSREQAQARWMDEVGQPR